MTVQGDIGVTIGLSERELNLGIQRVTQALNQLAQTVERIGGQIDKAMEQAASGAQQASRATKELTEEQKQAAEAARKHKEEQKRLREEQRKAAEEARRQRKALQDLREGLTQIGVAAGVMSAALLLAERQVTDALKRQQSAFLGLQSVAERTIGSYDAAREAAESLVEDGLMTIVEASQAVQAGLATGFDLQQTIDLINAFKDSAAFNRQAGLEFGEAVVRAMEGVRMGNSVLSDAAGITKNLSQILKEAGYAEQDLQRVQSDLNVRMALYTGILREAELFQGNAAKAADQLAGSESRVATAAFEAQAALGNALAPALQSAYDAMGPLLRSFTTWVEQSPEVARMLFLVAGGATAFASAISLASAALLAFNAAMGPVGWLIAGVSAAVGGMAGMALHVQATTRAQQEQVETVVALADKYERLNRVLSDSEATEAERAIAQQEHKAAIEEIGEMLPELVTKWDEHGKAVEIDTERLKKHTEALRDDLKAQREQAMFDAARAEKEKRDELEQFLRDKEQAKSRFIAENMQYSGIKYGPEAEALRQRLEEEFERQYAEEEARLRSELAKAQAETDRLAAMAAGPDERGRGSYSRSGGTGTGGDTPPPPPPPPPPDPFKSSLRWVDHLKRMDQLTLQEEIAMLEEIKAQHATTAEQVMQIDERIYAAHKQLAEQAAAEERAAAEAAEQERQARLQSTLRLLDHELRMGRATTEDEIHRLQEILETHELTTEERMSLEERLASAQQRFLAEIGRAHREEQEQMARTEEERIRAALARLNHQVRMGELTREQEIAALEQHLEEEAAYYRRHADERWELEERIYDLKQQLREEDLRAQEQAQQQAMQQQMEWIRLLADADIDAMRRRQEAAERAKEAKIRALQDELDALERLWAAEDRRNRIQDLRDELEAVKADTRFQKVLADGSVIYTYDEARARELEKQLADAEREDERARIRERLQDQIRAAQDELAAMRDRHQRALDARQQFWSDLQGLDLTQYEDLVQAAEQGLGDWVSVFRSKLSELQAEADRRSREIAEAMNRINTAMGAPAVDIPSAPTLPASIAAATGAGGVNQTIGQMTVVLPEVKSPEEFVERLPSVAQSTGVDLNRLIRTGRGMIKMV